jgi:hypothetical protein
MMLAILAASLLGSLHCVGMCGAFVAVATMDPSARAPAAWVLHAAYHGGRLVTYLVLGALAGLLGQALDFGGDLAGLPKAAAVASGSIMILFGATQALRVLGVRLPRLPLPPGVSFLVERGHRLLHARGPITRAVGIGLLTTLLPCGWLYAFAATAAGSADPVKAVGVMAAFWLGTLPALAAVGAGLQRLTGSARRHMPLATAVLLVVVGVTTVVVRVRPAFVERAPGRAPEVVCHGP